MPAGIRPKAYSYSNIHIIFITRRLSLLLMSSEQDASRRNLAAVLAIVLGLAIGLFIKRVRVGLLIGIVLGVVAIMLYKRKRS